MFNIKSNNVRIDDHSTHGTRVNLEYPVTRKRVVSLKCEKRWCFLLHITGNDFSMRKKILKKFCSAIIIKEITECSRKHILPSLF